MELKPRRILFPLLTSGRRRKHDTSLDASDGVCRMTLKDTTKEAKLHGLAVSFLMRHPDDSFLSFHLTTPECDLRHIWAMCCRLYQNAAPISKRGDYKI